jgi:hypothetical protein
VGIKCDLEDKRVVSKAEGEELSAKLSAIFFETFALADITIGKAFKALVNKRKKQCQSSGTSFGAPGSSVSNRTKMKGCRLL